MHSHKHDFVFAAVTAVMLATMATGTQMLPLEGQATPMYGDMPVHQAAPKKSSSSRSRAPRVITRTPASSSSSSAAALATDEKLAAFGATGDLSCFRDSACVQKLNRCSVHDTWCSSSIRRLWTVNALFPECPTAKDPKDCEAGIKYVLSDAAPAALKTCRDDVICRELLATFRQGDFTCRTYWKCQDALEAMLKDAQCTKMAWCKNVQTIDLTYTNFAIKCTSKDKAACAETLGIDRFVSKAKRRLTCELENICHDDVMAISFDIALTASKNDGSCFLLPACKTSFQEMMAMACDRKERDLAIVCGRYQRIWTLLTETTPSCVTSGNTPTCIKALDKARTGK